MHGVCMAYAWRIYTVCMAYAWRMHGVVSAWRREDFGVEQMPHRGNDALPCSLRHLKRDTDDNSVADDSSHIASDKDAVRTRSTSTLARRAHALETARYNALEPFLG